MARNTSVDVPKTFEMEETNVSAEKTANPLHPSLGFKEDDGSEEEDLFKPRCSTLRSHRARFMVTCEMSMKKEGLKFSDHTEILCITIE